MNGPQRAAFRIGMGFALIATLVLSGCQSFNVHSDWDPTVELTTLRQFHFVEPPESSDGNPFADNSLLRKRLRLAIETVLAERGYPAVEDPADADFLVTYDVLIDEKIRVDGVASTIGGFPYRQPFGYGTGYTSTNVSAYQESTLLIDILDPISRDLIWRGWGQGIVQTRDRDRGEERLRKGVNAILAPFPAGRSGER